MVGAGEATEEDIAADTRDSHLMVVDAGGAEGGAKRWLPRPSIARGWCPQNEGLCCIRYYFIALVSSFGLFVNMHVIVCAISPYSKVPFRLFRIACVEPGYVGRVMLSWRVRAFRPAFVEQFNTCGNGEGSVGCEKLCLDEPWFSLEGKAETVAARRLSG